MNPVDRHIRRLMALVAGGYSSLLWHWLNTGMPPYADAWIALGDGVSELMRWVDLSAMADLRYRATGQRIIIPAGGGTVTAQAVLATNPTTVDHASATHPIAEWRGREWAKSEQQYAEKLMERRKLLAENKPLTGKLLDYRMRRMRREQLGEIANISEQVELAVPEIGRMFPFTAYYSREDWRVRPTHRAMHGFVAQRKWWGWRYARPLNGYNCRCYVRHYAIHEAKRFGWLDGNDRPRFETKWPTKAAEANWANGMPYHDNGNYYAVPKELRSPVRVFPDPGIWMLPRAVSFDLSGAATAVA